MTNPLFDLRGRVALVTGGSKGLGKAMARGFAEAGADVIISSRHEDELKAALAEITSSLDVRGAYFVADMTNRREVDTLAAKAIGAFGKVDILVNNAGGNTPQAIDSITDADWDRTVELNLSSCMALTRALAPQMKARRWGRIIHISSIMGLASKEKRNAYSATKAALIGTGASQLPGLGRIRHHGQLHRAGTISDRSARQAVDRRGEKGLCRAHGLGTLGRTARIGGAGAAARQRSGQLHYRRDDRGRWRHVDQNLLDLPHSPRVCRCMAFAGRTRTCTNSGRRFHASTPRHSPTRRQHTTLRGILCVTCDRGVVGGIVSFVRQFFRRALQCSAVERMFGRGVLTVALGAATVLFGILAWVMTAISWFRSGKLAMRPRCVREFLPRLDIDHDFRWRPLRALWAARVRGERQRAAGTRGKVAATNRRQISFAA